MPLEFVYNKCTAPMPLEFVYNKCTAPMPLESGPTMVHESGQVREGHQVSHYGPWVWSGPCFTHTRLVGHLYRPTEFCLCGLWFVVNSVNTLNAHWMCVGPIQVLNGLNSVWFCVVWTGLKTKFGGHLYFQRLLHLRNALPDIDLTKSFKIISHHLNEFFWNPFLRHWGLTVITHVPRFFVSLS